MKSMASTDAKTNFGALLDAAQRGPVAIKKKNRRVAVVISAEDYDGYKDYQHEKLEEIHAKLKEGLGAADRGEFVDGEEFMAKLLVKSKRRLRARR